MSLLPALDETEKSPGHGWNTSSRFGIDSSNGGKQFDYHHLINQNNAGEVPDALVEEEVIQENETQSEVNYDQQKQQQTMQPQQTLQQQQQQQQTTLQQQHTQQQAQQQQAHQQQQQQKVLPQHDVKQNTQAPNLSQQQRLYQQQQQLQQKQAMLQNMKVIVQQTSNKKAPQQNLMGKVVHSGKQQMAMPNKSVRHPSPQQVGQNFNMLQGQNRLASSPQQSMLNSNTSQNEEEINQQILQGQREIEENNKRLASFGLPPVSTVISAQSEFHSQQQILNNSDYMGSVSVQSSPNQSNAGNRIRQMLAQPQSGPTQRKVDINFVDSNGAFQTNQNPKTPQGVQGPQKTQVITVSGRGQSLVSQPPQRPGIVQLPSQALPGNRTTSTSYQSPVQVQTVSTNQTQSLSKTGNQMQKINKNNVVLEGGGQFEEGQAYVIRDRHGNARTMVWNGGEFFPFGKEKGAMSIQHSTIDSSQRGRGARGGRNRGRGRGQGQLHGNATGVHMTQNIRGTSPLNNGMRLVRHDTPIPGRPQINFMRQNLLNQVGHPSNQQMRHLSTQGHVIHTSPGSPSMPVINVVTSAGAGGQIVQQMPKLALQNLMPAQQIKPKTGEENPSEQVLGMEQDEEKGNEPAGTDKEHVLDPPNIPNDPSAYAVCQYCGTTSMDKFKCESCKRTFTSATKYVIPNSAKDGNPDTKRRKITIEPGTTVSTISVDKGSFYNKKFQEQSEIYVKVINASNNAAPGLGQRHQPRIIRGYGRGKRGRGRGRGTFVPETVTISSDEEESGPGDVNKSQSQSMSAPATPASVPSRSPSHAGDQPECPESPVIPNIPLSKKTDKARVKKMEDAEGTNSREKSPSPVELTLNARTVRVGNFRGAPVEPILISDSGLNFFIEGVTGTHTFHLYPQEIQQCLAKFDGDPNLIFFLTSQPCALRTRKDLGMVVHADPSKPAPELYFDPSSTEMQHQMITIVMEQVPVETRLDFQKYMELFKSWGKAGDEAFFMELSKAEADEIFRQSTSVRRIQGNVQMSTVADHGYSQAGEDDRQSDRSPSPKIGFVGPIIKLLTYPPPPAKGGISITNEDLYCLQEGEFLNDVIIDFYLKYLLRERLSQEDHDRTHIFSSFFYKRLTQRIRGAAIDDDPNVTLPVKRHARVKTWTRKLDLFKKDFIVIPINEHAHWFLAIICFPGLEKPVEHPYIPKQMTTPLIDPASCPTPPQPTDDVDEDGNEMETEESEDPLSNSKTNDTAIEKPATKETIETSSEVTDSQKKEISESEPVAAAADNDSKLETQSEKNEDSQSEKMDSSEKSETQSEKAETQSEKADTESNEGKEKQTGSENGSNKSESSKNDATVVRQTRSMRTLLKSIRGKAVPESDPIPPDAMVGFKQPCIMIFDSLPGPSRKRIVTVLKEYLQVEWAVKKGGSELNKNSIKNFAPTVPQQNNYSDCGVYMLQYVESFFEDPIQDFSYPIKECLDWFSAPKIEGKREELRDLIIELKEKYESKT